MALQKVTSFGVLRRPGAYVDQRIQATAGGIGTTGVLALVGEADMGPRFSLEADLSANAFGPDALADVVAKYGSGPLVDAFREACAAASDPEITGSFSSAILVKTNAPGTASGSLTKWGGGTWGTIADRKGGRLGNNISYSVAAAQAEVLPSTGAFTFLPPIASTDINFRVNGGAAVAYNIPVGQLPSAFVTGVDALAGVAASGGADRGVVGGVAGTLALAVVSGNQVTVTIAGATFAAVPSVGDTMYISATSVIKGGANQNVGAYVVTAATNTTISATKLLDASGTPNQVTAPIGVGAVAVASTTADVRAFAPVTITLEAGNPVDGMGKSLEIAELTSQTGRLSYLCYALSTTPVTWVSKSGAATSLTATEYKPRINVARQVDGLSEEISEGGQVALALGYLGTTGSAVIAAGIMTITVVGGSGTSPAAIRLADHPTIGDLVSYLNTLTGFSAAAGTTSLASQPASSLDEGTFTIASTFGARNGRIKQDAYRLKAAFANSANVQLLGTQPVSGAPAVANTAFLSGGSRGVTTDADVAAAMVALQGVDCNFVIPLFSNNAATDIADGLTESLSTYTIDGVIAATRSHVLSMSTAKARRRRQGFLSYRGTFQASQDAANNVGHGRFCMPFEDVRVPNSAGTVVQQRPWMAAVKAAAMQAAAFRRLIVNKGINLTGAVHAAGDFNRQLDSHVETALLAGLLPIGKADGGGWYWISDQTCYTKDDNFYHNSIQAVYVGDIIARTFQTRLERAIVGQSVADMTRSMVLAICENILGDLKDLGLIAPSDDAPKGYKNLTVKIAAPSVEVGVEVKEATGLYFIPVALNISAVTQSA